MLSSVYRGKPMGTYPYRTGSPCSSCPVGTQCSEDLCEYDIHKPYVPTDL